MICKCGDEISERASEGIKRLPLKSLNIPVYDRCEACLRILTSSVLRLQRQGKKYNFYAKR
jgi:hypothetical protein